MAKPFEIHSVDLKGRDLTFYFPTALEACMFYSHYGIFPCNLHYLQFPERLSVSTINKGSVYVSGWYLSLVEP